MKKRVRQGKKEEIPQFPRYLLKVNGKRIFYSFFDAVVLLDSGFENVRFGRYVLNADFSVSLMREEDREKLLKAADEYGASK